MPTPKQPAHKVGFDDMSDVSGQTHSVRKEGGGVSAVFEAKKVSSKEPKNKAAIAQMKKDRAERRKFQKKLNCHLNNAAWDGLKAMALAVDSSYREYGFSQEDIVEQIILEAAERWNANPDEHFILERFEQIANG